MAQPIQFSRKQKGFREPQRLNRQRRPLKPNVPHCSKRYVMDLTTGCDRHAPITVWWVDKQIDDSQCITFGCQLDVLAKVETRLRIALAW